MERMERQLVQETMERTLLFRFTTVLYFVDKIARAEGSSESVREDIWAMLERTEGTTHLVIRIAEMDSMERLQALSHLIDLLKIFAAGSRILTNQQWVDRVERCFLDGDDDDDDDSAFDDADPANSIYELLAVKLPGGGELDFIGTVLKGCNLISLDGLCLLAGIPETFSSQIKKRTIGTGHFWRIKCPYRGVELFLDCREAARYCRSYCLSPKAQRIIHWLDQQSVNPPKDPAYRHRFRMLEAVDSTQYVITFLGKGPGAGRLVLIRASDGHVHVASFMKACVGLPVTEMEVWDDECALLRDLLRGPGNMRLDQGQIEVLTIPIPPPPPVIVVD